MTTKEQERKALAQIKKIVEGLGEDSYIGTAFEGCFEIAEENIENDWACSMKQRWETAEQACDLRREEAYKLQEELELTKKELELAKKSMKQEQDRTNGLWDRLKETERVGSENLSKFNEYSIKVREQEHEIMKLKAKLYDLIVK